VDAGDAAARDAAAGDAAADAGAPDCVPNSVPDAAPCCRERCNGNDDDCDGRSDESDRGPLCELAFASSLCSAGVCAIESCAAGHEDCNESAEDGCETSLDSNSDCGVCGHACAIEHGTARCLNQACAVDGCEVSFGDCDGKPANGCERSLNTLTDCGGCGHACHVAHAVTSCAGGSCEIVSCDLGFADCNSDATKLDGGDGCETELVTPANCGACGRVCSGAMPYCSGGQCSALQCSAGTADCDANNVLCEVDLHTINHCGACGIACGALANATPSCPAGSCVPVCTAGFKNCDSSASNGCETSIRSNSNCGDCGSGCNYANATTSCSTGSCQLTACATGYGNCNADLVKDGCEQPLNTNQNCGQCGVACTRSNAVATCSSGSCQIGSCQAGFGNCDANAANGCETNVATSNQNCGACGLACASNRTCVASRCVCTSDNNCASGQHCCNGSCVDTRSDEANCGACGQACASAGTCCSSSCKTLASDLNNCGSCGARCDNDSNVCTAGKCKCADDDPCSGFRRCCASGCQSGFCN
jgi:hypothetical protein